MGQQRLLNYGEVAELLAVSTKTVQRLVARAELPVVRVAGAVRFDVDDVEDYVQRCRSARNDPRSAAAPRRVRGSAARVVASHRPGSMVR